MNERYAKCIPFDKNVKGRIGGNPPKCIEEQIPSDYKFYATLVHPEKKNKMLSILVHEDYHILIYNNIYPSITVKVVEHEYSEIGSNIQKAFDDLGVQSISVYTDMTNKDDFLFIKVGGEPCFIQEREFYYEELEREGYSFFLQIDEEGYGDGLLKGSYIFNFGALYLYKHNITGNIIAGFWQYS
mgnify:CR=1 FL=1